MGERAFRFAEADDAPKVLFFIEQLAAYEKLSDQVVATAELLHEQIFKRHGAEVVFVLEDGVEVGFALFYSTFSTFLGLPGIHLEDLFVLPEHRGKGHGKALICELARIAVERGCGRLEWDCLDWNEPSLAFYRTLGAQRLDEWVGHRVEGDVLHRLADGRM